MMAVLLGRVYLASVFVCKMFIFTVLLTCGK